MLGLLAVHSCREALDADSRENMGFVDIADTVHECGQVSLCDDDHPVHAPDHHDDVCGHGFDRCPLIPILWSGVHENGVRDCGRCRLILILLSGVHENGVRDCGRCRLILILLSGVHENGVRDCGRCRLILILLSGVHENGVRDLNCCHCPVTHFVTSSISLSQTDGKCMEGSLAINPKYPLTNCIVTR